MWDVPRIEKIVFCYIPLKLLIPRLYSTATVSCYDISNFVIINSRKYTAYALYYVFYAELRFFLFRFPFIIKKITDFSIFPVIFNKH